MPPSHHHPVFVTLLCLGLGCVLAIPLDVDSPGDRVRSGWEDTHIQHTDGETQTQGYRYIKRGGTWGPVTTREESRAQQLGVQGDQPRVEREQGTDERGEG